MIIIKEDKLQKYGAIACYSGGSTGAGHVRVVEEVYPDGSYLVSESLYGGTTEFKTSKVNKNNFYTSSHKFLGFVYCPIEFENKPEPSTYTIGVYKTLTDMYVRTGAGTNFSVKKYKNLTSDGKRNAVYKNPNDNAVYKKGTKFNALEILASKDKKTKWWARTPSGYVCLVGENSCYANLSMV
jgi:hypothetical protein